MGKSNKLKKEIMEEEENSEDYCFVCKDGGLLIICDHKNCLKAYHPDCVAKEESTEEEGNWICDWHKCLLCKQCSKYQCYGCPNAVCHHCLKDFAFARVRGSKGLCNDCLHLALLGDEGMEVDSDGEKVDFKDRETYEGLFKEYWDIIKEKEGLTLEDLHHADVQIKKGENVRSLYLNKEENIKAQLQQIDSDSEEYSNENENKRSASDNHDSDDALQPILLARTEKRRKKLQKKRKGSQTIEFVGWASKSLIEFLKLIRVDTNKKQSQDVVASIIKKYVQDHKLFHPEKKTVMCDLRLRSLFGRTTFNMYKIDDLLEPHFLENVVQLEDDDDEDEGFSTAFKKENAVSEEAIREEGYAVNVQHSIFASITLKNMKLIYLKRCLVEELMKHYETFESKAIGSFVKVKSDPVDVKCPYQLLPITGISKHSGDESNKNILLRISTLPNEVPICLLSNDDLSEEDCENLRQKVDNGLLKMLTVVKVEEKAKSLHEDITKHWISRELSILRHRIDLANEKGRRVELFEYRRRKELLQSEGEQSRLLKEVPQVIADVIDIKPASEPSHNPASKPYTESASISASDTDESQDKTDVGIIVCGLASIENYQGKIYPTLSAQRNFRGRVKAYHPCFADKEEAAEESSEKINFKYEETYAGLFKACHDIIKEKGSLTLEDLHYADVLIKTGKNVRSHYNKKGENFEPQNEKSHKRYASDNHDNDGSLQPMRARITKRPKRLQAKCKGSKTIKFVGWASKSLIEFLGSIGADTNMKRSQDDVASLINEYVHDQKLFHPEKKKVVLCDMRLRSLLGRMTFNLYKILDLLEPHFLENVEQSEDENEDEDEDERSKQSGGNKCGSHMDEFQPKIDMSEEVKRKECNVQVQYSSFATITLRNMNLVYLKRCLAEQLMKQSVDFEDKVVGSFVKIKSDSVDAKHPYHFLPVIGINKASGDDNGKILLQVSTLPSEVPICLLSNNNLSKEDCDYLQQKVKDGLLEKPTVVELEQKAKSLHEDMTKHWIDRELSILRHRIDLANEKGRRAELFEYRRRRELLQSQEEQSRLLKEVPQVIADVIEIKTASKPASVTDAEPASETDNEHASKLVPESE